MISIIRKYDENSACHCESRNSGMKQSVCLLPISYRLLQSLRSFAMTDFKVFQQARRQEPSLAKI